MSLSLPAALGRRLFLVDQPLLVERYREALATLNGQATRLEEFHVDAAGWSPEIAAELQNPTYLGHGPLHPSFLVVSVDQLVCPVIQPNAGFAWIPYRMWASSVRGELADLTLREPVFGEISHGITRFLHPAQLGLVRTLKLVVRTPTDRLAHATEIAAMKTALIEGESQWRDEAFLTLLAERARHAQGWQEVPAALRHGRDIAALPSFSPAFGGSYVWPGSGDNEPTAWVLCRNVSTAEAEGWPALAEAAGVLLLPLTPESAIEFQVEHGIAATKTPARRLQTTTFDELQSWIALHHFVSNGRLTAEAALQPLVAMRTDPDPPLDYLELEDLRLRAGALHGDVDLGSYSALTRLRVMPIVTDEPTHQVWARHLRAYLDPVQAPRVVRDAADLAVALISGLSPELAGALDRACAEVGGRPPA